MRNRQLLSSSSRSPPPLAKQLWRSSFRAWLLGMPDRLIMAHNPEAGPVQWLWDKTRRRARHVRIRPEAWPALSLFNHEAGTR